MTAKYGHFDDDNREYVITNPSTPTKWINYVGSLEFGGFVDHTGGSLLCAGDPALNRIVKYLPQLPDTDFKGSTLYIRVRTASGQEVYSPFFTPCLDDLESYECRVGLSYQTITSSVAGIQVQAQIFVPYGACLEIRDIKVTNNRDEAVEIDIIPVVEYTHFDALKQFTNADWCPQTMMSEAQSEEGGLLTLFQYAFMRKQGKLNFMSSNRPVDSFESDRKRFLGTRGTWAKPEVMEKDSFSSYEARRGDNIGALLIKLGSLAPGQTERTLIYTGQCKREDAAGIINHFRDEKNVDQSFKDLSNTWDNYLSAYQCETPDPNIDAMLNVHNPRQCQTTFYWSRYLSLYQLGLGARGLGFRDSSQDSMGVLASIPKEAKELQKKLLSIQKADGSAMHQFFPSTMEANEGDSREEGDKQWYGDDHIWIVLAVCAYLRETGDYAFLDEEITFYEKKVKLQDRAKASVLEHLKRSLAYTKSNTGQHGLPLLGFADWNDTVNLPGDAESLMIASLYGTALNEMIDLCSHLGDEAQAEQYRDDHAAMKEVVNEHGWDGEWYRRYYTASGEPIGSKENEYGRIYTNGQSWPVIAGFADAERAKTALDSVDKHLNTKFGIKLSTPGYNGYDEDLGGVSSYPPGAKENGGIFLHSNPWVMIANALIGDGDRAYKYFCQINPAARNEDIDLFEVEPYCFPQNILGDEHPQFGLGRNSWLSGTSSWTYQAATQYILGVKPGHDGLVVTPCAPADWTTYKVVRKYRGATYNITVKNELGKNAGHWTLTVNGNTIEGNVVPIAEAGSVVEVTATSSAEVAASV
ncbi:glycosyl transferase [Oceaniferula spumae]|uniref:Glycosyl transferase n=1 Tax=Oceaniferula spumae TaxID=2979115 RepID=A0AAT9FGK2_9BACT